MPSKLTDSIQSSLWLISSVVWLNFEPWRVWRNSNSSLTSVLKLYGLNSLPKKTKPDISRQVLVQDCLYWNIIWNSTSILSMKFEPAFGLTRAELCPFCWIEHFCRGRRCMTTISRVSLFKGDFLVFLVSLRVVTYDLRKHHGYHAHPELNSVEFRLQSIERISNLKEH